MAKHVKTAITSASDRLPCARQMMGDINFLMSLTQFPKEQINDETVELLRPYFAAPDFNYNAAKKVS
jgi:dynein heavy chain